MLRLRRESEQALDELLFDGVRRQRTIERARAVARDLGGGADRSRGDARRELIRLRRALLRELGRDDEPALPLRPLVPGLAQHAAEVREGILAVVGERIGD